jgi:NAD(P)-dependent dehydrogenase (short-subunit alcohol dehydrogenase family)
MQKSQHALRFDDKVAIVTGAGSGLGRVYALELAKRGAKVVVNDLGVSLKGEGLNSKAADLVVSEIKSFGGEAVANYSSVEQGASIVEFAVKHYGKIDILINNAGILRDVTLQKMTDADWDVIISVHLTAAFTLAKAAWKHKYGRIINTSSTSGLYGNFGQSNYAAAKLGLHGLTQTLGKEGDKNNIKVNTIAPFAGSRMNKDLWNEVTMKKFNPEKVVPLVMFLCHEKNEENGALFELGAGFMARVRWQRAEGVLFPDGFTAEDLMIKWGEVVDFGRSNDYPLAMTDTLQKVMNLIEASKPKI